MSTARPGVSTVISTVVRIAGLIEKVEQPIIEDMAGQTTTQQGTDFKSVSYLSVQNASASVKPIRCLDI